ncbi:uncharacterized protein DMAD_07663 [Drosophila madeirensis]|uniref:Retrotransposon gag domain-containing protein n=1 Tax=Drosophila madeirensis TaxID=30013 RepID=A0AAU9F6C5_DROMD
MAQESIANLNIKVQQMMQLLTLKIEADERRDSQVKISASNFEKILSDFDVYSIPVGKWFDIFEHNAEAYELSEKQKYVQARGKMCGAAKLFLESECVSNYEDLKDKLICEFETNTNSADIHQLLRNRKMQKAETFHEYMLSMKKLASVVLKKKLCCDIL